MTWSIRLLLYSIVQTIESNLQIQTGNLKSSVADVQKFMTDYMTGNQLNADFYKLVYTQ